MSTFLLALLLSSCLTITVVGADDNNQYINITILDSTIAEGAVCLDGSPPAYHLDKGYGSGISSWIIVMDGGAWCQSIPDCLNRSTTELGSSKQMKNGSRFAGILYNNPQNNPDFYNWNKVRVKYCDGSSNKLTLKTISGTSDIQKMYQKVVTLHGSAKNLPPSCTSTMEPSLCFFPQNVVPYVETPLFIINSHYDSWQAFERLNPSLTRGYFITSCHSHGAIMSTNFWLSPSSPRLLHKTIGEAVADWFFDKAGFQYIDLYPCARDCEL